MFSVWTVASWVLCYLLILFLVAFLGDRHFSQNKQHPAIYSFAMGVHCTSWAFFGTTTQAAQYGWAFIPTYLGIILVMLFAYPLLRRIAQLCHQHRISSLADFIGMQYQKSHFLAAMVSILCFFGVVPYIALQLDAVSTGFEIVTGATGDWPGNIELYVTILMALFAIIFGTRSISLTDKHPGLMLTIAFESLIKLAALIMVGVFVCFVMFDGIFDLLGKAQLNPRAREIIYADSAVWVYLSHVILGICAMFCLPRQFHINYIENNGDEELRMARWLFPTYLVAMTIFVLPIALAGHMVFDTDKVSTDTYALALPVMADNANMSLIAFIGGLSAATSMVIVATLAVGIMISNNLITPLWLTLQLSTGRQHSLKPGILLFIRRLTVLLVLGTAYLYHLDVSQGSPLVQSGIIAIALLSQTMPILVLGMFWKKRNKFAAQIALLAGALSWFYWLLWPSIKASYYFDPAPTDMELGQGFMLSLLINLLSFVTLTLILPNRAQTHQDSDLSKVPQQSVKIASLLALTEKVLDAAKQSLLWERLKEDQKSGFASPGLMQNVESELASQVGSASARILLSAVAEKDQVALPQLVELVEEASQTFQFNHELLQSSVQHIQQGICVLDQDLNLLAWNQRYLEMFEYPAGIVSVGSPIRKLLQFNAHRGMLGNPVDADKEIEKRIRYMRKGSQYKYLRHQKSGQVIELNGSPLPGGGFVTTYSDISEYIDIQRQLQESKSSLESRVEQRTQELKNANNALASAKKEAESANESKTKFLAAAGHDLMQPFNAASLFAALLVQKSNSTEITELSHNLVQSLNNAEELLSMLLDMTRLDSGVLQTDIRAFPLHEVLGPLVNEFSIMAKQKGLELRYLYSKVIILSDKKLLRRILQNLISNAVRYTQSGAILVGAKRMGQEQLKLVVIDTGPGIEEQHHSAVFEEFSQLNTMPESQGLGLGLTIVDRISALLAHPIELRSIVGCGTHFSVTVPRVSHYSEPQKTVPIQSRPQPTPLLNKRVLVVENEVQTRQAMEQLLSNWGADVITASSIEQASVINKMIDLMILDYHLDHNETGIQVATVIRARFGHAIPGILHSANRDESIRNQAVNADLKFLPKPLKEAAFKRLIKQLKL